MKRAVVVLLALAAVVALAAAFVLMVLAPTGAPAPTDGAAPGTSGAEVTGADAQSDETPAGVDVGGRRRVQMPDADGAAGASTGARLSGVVLAGTAPVAGARVTVYAAGDSAAEDRAAEGREAFGDLFSADELRELERDFGSFGGGRRANRQVEFATESEPTQAGASEPEVGETRVSVSFGSRSSVSVEGDGEIPDLESEEVQNAMGRGMEMAGRMMRDPALMERILDFARLRMAGFEPEPTGAALAVVTSDADGAFVVEGLATKRVLLRVQASGYARASTHARVGATDVVVQLVPGGVLQGVVTSAGKPVVGAEVRTKNATTVTDAAGAFSVEGAVLPEESLLVTARGHVAHAQQVRMEAPGTPTRVAVELAGAALVRGVVRGSDGAPVAGAAVRVSKGGGFNPAAFMELANRGSLRAPAPAARTDASGAFELDGIPPGDAKLRVDARDRLPATVALEALRAGEQRAIDDIVLARQSTLTGHVYDAEGAPLAGAKVKVSLPAPEGFGAMLSGMFGGNWATATSDASGAYTVTGFEGGVRTVRVESAVCLDAETELDIPAERSLTHDFRLEPGHTLDGVVLSPEGDPVAGAKVAVKMPGGSAGNPMAAMFGGLGEPDASATTDEEGRFRMGGLEAGPYTVSASAQGWLDAELADVAQDSTGIALQLRRPALVRGIVLAADGSPVPGAEVLRRGGRSRGAGNPMLAMMRQDARTTADAAGRFEIDGLEPGAYELYARHREHADSEHVKLKLAAGEQVDGLELQLRPGVAIVGVVVEKDGGAPVANAVVYVSLAQGAMAAVNVSDFGDGDPQAPANSLSARTAADGSFRIDGLTPGRVTVEVRARDHAPTSLARIEAPSEGLRVEIGRGGSVAGTVTGADGRPLAGEQLMLTGGAMGFGTQRSATSDANGEYRFERLSPGAYQIMRLDTSAAFGMGGMTPVVVKEGEVTRKDFAAAASGAAVAGRVQRDGKGVEGAMVVLTGGAAGMKIATSSNDGSFRFEGLADGSYTLSVQEDLMGGGTSTAEASVEQGRSVEDVVLQLSSLRLEGRVVDEDGKPVALAQLFLVEPGSTASGSLADLMRNQRGQAITDERGRFRMASIPAGTYSLRVTASGYVQQTLEGVTAGQDVTVRLRRGAEFEVTVLGPDDAPVQGATVVVQDGDGQESVAFGMALEGVSNQQGVAVLRLGPGRHRLLVESVAHPATTVEVDAAAGSAVVRLSAGGALEITVRRAGQAVEGASIELLDASGAPLRKRISLTNFLGGGRTTDSAGVAVAEGLASGEVTVVVTPPGGQPVRRSARVVAGGTERVTIELP